MKFFDYLIDVSLITFIRDRDANNLLLKSKYKLNSIWIKYCYNLVLRIPQGPLVWGHHINQQSSPTFK